MTFKDVAMKNFKFNIKKYFAYFLCSSFAITILFMYSTLLFNDEIIKELGKTDVYDMMKICLIIIGVFCFFFISYAHSAFMKTRSKEFGLFLTLGMTKKDINKIIKIENSTIISISLIFGLLAGTILSRLFFMIVTKILNLKKINYTLNYKSYALSIGLFLLICIVVILIIKIYTNKLEITELLKSNRKGYSKKADHPLLGILGVISIVVSFVLMHYTIKEDIFKHQQYIIAIYVCMCLAGLYFGISEFGSLSIKLSKKNKNYYFNNVINLNEINHKFNQNKKILYVVSILSGVAIFFIGITFGIYVTTRDSVMKDYPYDIMYVETKNENKTFEDNIKKVVDNEKNPLKEMYKVDFIEMALEKTYEGKLELWSDREIVFSESQINKILKKPIDVRKGKIVSCWYKKELNPWARVGDKLKIKTKQSNESYELDVQEEIYGSIVDYMVWGRFRTIGTVILDDEDYKNIVNKSKDIDTFSFHLLNFKDWKNTETAFNNLMTSLKESNGMANDKNVWKTFLNARTMTDKGIETLRPVSKLEMFDSKIKENGFYFFVMSFIGVLFFISSGVVLYFKIYTDIDDGKENYKRLFKIGITDKDMKKIISKELKPIFFIPVILGSIVSSGYTIVLFVNFSMYKQLLAASVVVIIFYLMMQTIFYFITKGKYLNEIL